MNWFELFLLTLNRLGAPCSFFALALSFLTQSPGNLLTFNKSKKAHNFCMTKATDVKTICLKSSLCHTLMFVYPKLCILNINEERSMFLVMKLTTIFFNIKKENSPPCMFM